MKRYWNVTVEPTDEGSMAATLLSEAQLSVYVNRGELAQTHEDHGKPNEYFRGQDVEVSDDGLHALAELTRDFHGCSVSHDIDRVAQAALELGLKLGAERERAKAD